MSTLHVKQGNKKQEVMDKVRSELALANAQELINVSSFSAHAWVKLGLILVPIAFCRK